MAHIIKHFKLKAVAMAHIIKHFKLKAVAMAKPQMSAIPGLFFVNFQSF